MSFGDTDDMVLLATTLESLLDDRFDSSRRRLVSFSWQIFHSSSMLEFSITRKAPFRITNASCITSIRQHSQPTLLALPRPRLIRAFPCSAACAISAVQDYQPALRSGRRR